MKALVLALCLATATPVLALGPKGALRAVLAALSTANDTLSVPPQMCGCAAPVCTAGGVPLSCFGTAGTLGEGIALQAIEAHTNGCEVCACNPGSAPISVAGTAVCVRVP